MNEEKQAPIIEMLRKSLMVPVFYHEDYAVCEAVLSICFEEGIEVFEFTNRGGKAAENFARLQQLVSTSFPGKALGIGTIKTEAEAKQFAALHPAFVVSPCVNPQVGDICTSGNIPWMPGCMTPTEVLQATLHGATVVKVFPASVVGPGFIKAVKAVFPDVSLMPTGGISADSEVLRKWFDAGVLCVGMGSELIDRDSIQNRNWQQLRKKIKAARETALTCIS